VLYELTGNENSEGNGMIQLKDVEEENWRAVAHLSVGEEQQGFLDRPIGIIARGYVYRDCNARVFAIAVDSEIVGVALVRDLDEAPACYDLQQFMIDQRFQNKGYGQEALRLIIALLQAEGKYNCIEVCVNKNARPALHIYQKAGFQDTGYTDEAAKNCLNLMYFFSE
jgi:RimJ/RimL family protein N-acetyltransferase